MMKPSRALYTAAALFTALPTVATTAQAEKGDPIAPVAKAQSCKRALHDGFIAAIAAKKTNDGILTIALKDIEKALAGGGPITNSTAQVIEDSLKANGFTEESTPECRDFAYRELRNLIKPSPVMVQRTYRPGALSR